MMKIDEVIDALKRENLNERLKEIYVDDCILNYQVNRYINALNKYRASFGDDEITIFSAPGRSEIGGNHTDHQKGKVLVAAVNVDAIAIVHKSDNAKVNILSDGYELISIDINNLDKKKSEEGITISLIKGVISGIKERGYKIGGFNAYITSDVVIGAGLSSSAAFETVIGTIISGLFNDMSISDIEIAFACQYAENHYFGKPCGLMDQMACSVGNLVYIDFNDINRPYIRKVNCDFEQYEYSLCITDTKSSHADCTPEYAAVPSEMKSVANIFNKEVLSEVSEEEIFTNISIIRNEVGDRATLRAIHFVMENKRVEKEVQALEDKDFEKFLEHVKASGNSSFKYLQNVYINKDVNHQNVSIALALSDVFLDKNGVCRVHGGGFAGTIQAFVKNDIVDEYKKYMNNYFGDGSCNVYKVRKYGGIKVM